MSEDYRWLERWDEAAVKEWTVAQKEYARSHLDTLPGAEVLRGEVEAILKSDIVAYYDVAWAGGRLFAQKWAPPAQLPLIVAFDDWNDPSTERLIFDPNTVDESGSTAMDWYFPSRDGKLVAVPLSRGGSESGDLHIYEVATGTRSTRSFRASTVEQRLAGLGTRQQRLLLHALLDRQHDAGAGDPPQAPPKLTLMVRASLMAGTELTARKHATQAAISRQPCG